MIEPNVIVIMPEKCECSRFYKDRRDQNGKTMCSVCYSGLSVEDLKKLWGTPIPSLSIAIEQAGKGQVKSRGSFAKYVEENNDWNGL